MLNLGSCNFLGSRRRKNTKFIGHHLIFWIVIYWGKTTDTVFLYTYFSFFVSFPSLFFIFLFAIRVTYPFLANSQNQIPKVIKTGFCRQVVNYFSFTKRHTSALFQGLVILKIFLTNTTSGSIQHRKLTKHKFKTVSTNLPHLMTQGETCET